MQIEYSSNFLKALISTAAVPRKVHLMQNLRLRGRTLPVILAQIDRPMNAFQLCC